MTNHLTFTKWRDSAFSAEQLKSTRWLLNARPKNMPENFRDFLTVTPMAQAMLMQLHVHVFTSASRRLKGSARNRVRANMEEFEKLVDFSCIFANLRQEAKKVSSDTSVDGKLMEAFLARHLDLAKHTF